MQSSCPIRQEWPDGCFYIVFIDSPRPSCRQPDRTRLIDLWGWGQARPQGPDITLAPKLSRRTTKGTKNTKLLNGLPVIRQSPSVVYPMAVSVFDGTLFVNPPAPRPRDTALESLAMQPREPRPK